MVALGGSVSGAAALTLASRLEGVYVAERTAVARSGKGAMGSEGECSLGVSGPLGSALEHGSVGLMELAARREISAAGEGGCVEGGRPAGAKSECELCDRPARRCWVDGDWMTVAG